MPVDTPTASAKRAERGITDVVNRYIAEQTVQQGWSEKSAKRVESILLLFARYLKHNRIFHLHLRAIEVVAYFGFLQSVPRRHTHLTIAEIIALGASNAQSTLSSETRITHLEHLERFLTWAAMRDLGSRMYSLAWALADYERTRQGGRIRKGGRTAPE